MSPTYSALTLRWSRQWRGALASRPTSLARYSAGLDLGLPLVGVHVRRTDKIGFGVLQPQVLPVARYLGRAEAWWR